MRLCLRAARLLLCAAVAVSASPACYEAGGGTAPPTNTFYFPTGLAVSTGGNVLYAINSDFDLQWSGGTLQSYDLFQIRQDAAFLIQANLSSTPSTSPPPGIPLLDPSSWQPNCPYLPPLPSSNGNGVYPGQACAPPVDSKCYNRDSAIVGAFATDLQLSLVGGTRLFSPVAGNATVTWANVAADDPNTAPAPPPPCSPSAPRQACCASSLPAFTIDCGTRTDGRCAGDHQTGNDPNSEDNTRNVTMPGEPFGLAQTQDGTAMVVTSETDTKSSVLTTGLSQPPQPPPFDNNPTMQFVVDGLPNGGVGLAAIPHDPLVVTRCEDVDDQPPCVRPAFLETFRGANEVDLLRYWDDDGSSLRRPFLVKEATFPITANSSGTDSRGIAIDPTQRLACEARATTPDEKLACAQTPARVFIANRTPSSLVVGQIGQLLPDGTYDPDALVFTGNVPLTDGPSKLYLAPIVDPTQHLALRLFVVCFDTNSIFVFDPNYLDYPEAIIYTGPGPYALAFDPFTFEQVAAPPTSMNVVPVDPRQPADLALKTYRFAYVASFTQSFVQVIDLDLSANGGSGQTFESIVYTLGRPTKPKGQ
jgi:hypothetical protein